MILCPSVVWMQSDLQRVNEAIELVNFDVPIGTDEESIVSTALYERCPEITSGMIWLGMNKTELKDILFR